ncbi:penicillin acylase family protein [Nocardioides mangrovi]|uniref:Penicillin acylase family protein n=1 Tax=Nocardioides mangrovi TaxID=2874580 RepID=A0ABS7U8R6_9ACTN|nr:penicillin acylase family protein [Nocardioides mangrovi]MBZ5737113.1 penicillin acylase family protein [Nocardioides mangrovi]
MKFRGNQSPIRLGLAGLLLVVPIATTAGVSTAADAAAQADSPYDVTIQVTKHGIPHIEGDTFADVAYGAGWATTAAVTCTLMDTILTARGERSLELGPDATYADRVGGSGTNLQWDTLVTDLHDRQVVESLLADPVAGPSDRAKSMVEAEAAGIDEWLSTHEITDPACADQDWIQPDVTSTDVWYAIYLAQLIGSTTKFLGAITTATPPGSGAKVAAPHVTAADLRETLGSDSGESFGSNATAVGGADTTTKRGMLLGNPHFPWLGRYRFTEMHLTVPGKLDVAGGALVGFPTINIGFNDDVAWSHTVSTAYRFTPYEYKTAGTPTSYQTANGTAQLERRDVQVQVKTDDGVETVTKTLWRTPQGYVLNSPENLMSWRATSFWAMRDANAEHLRTLDTFLSMGQASSAKNLLHRQDEGGGVPWVNTIAADRTGHVLYADHSVVPNVTDALAKKCVTGVGSLMYSQVGLPGLDGTYADSRCAWGTDADAERPGILGPQHLPSVLTKGWVMNANNSYWAPNDDTRLTGFPRIIGCEDCERSMRTKVVMSYVRNQLKKGKESPRTLRSHEYANRVYAAEVARVGGRLDQVCDATGETEACQVLHDWDGRSDKTSVGAGIFEEFVRIADANGVDLWKTPFSAAKPFTTPNTLSTSQDVVDTMAAAIQSLRDQGYALDAPYGSMHFSGDRGDEAGIPLGGGVGNSSGDANAASNNGSAIGGVTQGSSYIQAIAFTKNGVIARNVLTYGLYEDPSSPWSNDQTRIYSDEGWVSFPWTDAQIAKQLVDTVHLG